MMKLHRLIGLTILAGVLMVLSSCTREPVLDMDNGDLLMISPSLLDLRTRADGDALTEDDLKDDKYNENKVDRLDVFFFKSDNSFLKAYHITTEGGTVSHGGKDGYLLSNDWMKDGFTRNTAYTVYVVANSTNETIKTVESGVTLSDLQAIVLEDEDIYKRWHSSTNDATYTTSKTFLMNATVASWTITAFGPQLVNDEQVTLNRAAVKFVLDVSLSDAFKTRLLQSGDSYGAPSWKYVNFNTLTAEVPGGTAPAAVLKTSGSSSYLTVEQGTGDQAGHFTVVTYAYPQTWTTETAPDVAPAIFLSFPCYHGESSNAAYHYYYIPLCSNAITSTISNNLYKVNAVISSFGSSEVITNNSIDLNYEVMAWGAEYAADIDAQLIDYLVVSPTHYSFKGGQQGEFLSTTIKYYASSVVYKDATVKAYYIDKNGDEQSVASSQYEIGTPSNGVIEVKSKVPTNGTYQQIEFKLYIGTDEDRKKEETVYIRHYPLDFISAEEGSYSTYDFAGWVSPGTSSSYCASYLSNNNTRYTFRSSTNGSNGDLFNAKIFSGGKVCYLNANGTAGDQVNQTAMTNNQMYVLQLTSSNETYTVGRPILTSHTATVYGNNNQSLGTVTYYTSDDNVISPAFMLGSQLGAVGVFSSAQYAAIHCSLYKEVSNGVPFTGWRLPTKQEIQYMIDHQTNYGAAMAEVVAGRYYWALDGGYVYNANATGSDNSTESGSKYVRCVRDLSPEELSLINQFE